MSTGTLIFALHAITEGFNGNISITLWLTGAALIFIVAFIWRTLKSERPLIPFRAFNNRGAITVLAIGTLGGASLFPLTGYVPTLLQMAYGVPAWLAGISLVPLVIGVLVANLFSTRRLSKHGHYRHFYLAGLILAVIGMFWIYFFIQSLGVWVVVSGLAITGLGVGFFGQFTVTLAQAFSDSKYLGSVTSTVIVSRDMSSSIVATVAGGIFGFGVSSALARMALPEQLQGISLQPSDLALLDASLRAEVQAAYVEAFQPIFMNSLIAYILILVLAITVPKVALKTK